MAQHLQYVPFSSAIDSAFWHKLSKLKLEVFGLDDKPRPLHGFYSNNDVPNLPCRMNVDFTAFDREVKTPPRNFPTVGTLKLTNTVEDFKTCDKKQLLEDEAGKLWQDIVSSKALEEPALLVRFVLLSYADLKKYNYYYWFAFPALCTPENIELKSTPNKIGTRFTEKQIQDLLGSYDRKILPTNVGFFLVLETSDSVSVHNLSDFDAIHGRGKVLVCICDPSTLDEYPGWPLRNLLVLASYHWCDVLTDVEVLCLRDITKDGRRDVSHSITFTVKLRPMKHIKECPKCVGWEKNEKQKLGPRHVNLSASLDPTRLAESAVDLNLKLMRWRLLPELDLDKVAHTRCLLFGAGTLGCNVARLLLGWGVRNITLIDNGTVSYSNPVRQSLFIFQDSLNGGRPKAEAAAESLNKIFPGVNAEGISLSIPMPGHSVSESAAKQILEDVKRIECLVEAHDVLFLLMDTRESRWLPTMLGAAKHKLVINAALGFDTYLVIRHGLKRAADDVAAVDMSDGASFRAPIPGHDLGCYFCNDVVAPGDSTRDRTLDQQCTVSRPGMSMLASALAVELMVSVLQHPDGGYATADVSSDDSLAEGAVCPLGLVPHQLRGFLSRFHQVMPASRVFNKCTACSPQVVDMYKKEGFSFLLNVFNKPSYLEDLTGLTELHTDTNLDEIWEMSDDEEFTT